MHFNNEYLFPRDTLLVQTSFYAQIISQFHGAQLKQNFKNQNIFCWIKSCGNQSHSIAGYFGWLTFSAKQIACV